MSEQPTGERRSTEAERSVQSVDAGHAWSLGQIVPKICIEYMYPHLAESGSRGWRKACR
jgi:hypothetical protein